MANDCIPFYEPGGPLTCWPTVAVIGKRFVKVSGNRRGAGSPGLTTSVEGGNYSVAPAGVGERVLGVARYDAAIGKHVGVYTNPGIIVPVEAGVALAAGQQVQAGAAGVAVVAAVGGVPCGICMTAAGAGDDAEIMLLPNPSPAPAA